MKCSFCNKEIQKGSGLIYVKADGTLLYFDKRKCKKNVLDFKKKPSKLKWVKTKKVKKA